jgi:hypothetical protein
MPLPRSTRLLYPSANIASATSPAAALGTPNMCDFNRAVFGPWSPLDDTIKALQPRTAIFESLPGSGISAAE